MGRSWRVLFQINHFFRSTISLKKKWKKLTAKICLIVCALTETEDHINPFQADLSSPHHQVFDTFRWSERVMWNEQTVDTFSYLKCPKTFINVELMNEVIDIDPLFPKLWTVLNLKVFNIHSPAFSIQSPAFRVQRPESSIQSPESSVQRPESSVQSPAYGIQHPESSVQGPESTVRSLATRVQDPESNVQSAVFRVQGPESSV